MAVHLARPAASDANDASARPGTGGDASRRRRTLSGGAAPIAAGVERMGDPASSLGCRLHSRPATAGGALTQVAELKFGPARVLVESRTEVLLHSRYDLTFQLGRWT